MIVLGKSSRSDAQIDDWRCDGIHAFLEKKNENNVYTLVEQYPWNSMMYREFRLELV